MAIWDAMEGHFLRWTVTSANGDVSTKSITIFIIDLGVWVLRASGNLGCNGGTFFGGGRLQWIMMMWLDIERGNKGFWQCWQTEMDLLKGNNSAFWCYMYFWCQLFQVMISFGGLLEERLPCLI